MLLGSKASSCLVLTAIFLQLYIIGVKSQGSSRCSLNSSALGACPTPGPDTQTNCLSTCQADSGCGEGEKCCSTACGALQCTCSVPVTSCDNVDCRKGFVCIDASNGPECVQKRVAKNNTNLVPKCKPPCLKGQRCQLLQVACITQPCPKLPRCVAPQTDPCQEPLKIGPCKAAISRYYYNATAQQCEQFFWGGCAPNGNNFATEVECEKKCEDICNQPLKVGPCKAALKRYYYNTATQQCEVFSWGGCQPNDNNFMTEKDCESRCEGTCVYKSQSYENGQFFVDREDPCLQCQCQAGTVPCYRIPCPPPQCQNPVVPPGACCPVCDTQDDAAAAVADVSNVCPLLRCKVCETGNFPDENGCQTCKCKPNASVCMEPLKIGPCKALTYRYFYNATSGQCQRFGWGGCSPNGNNFLTERECQAVCEKGSCLYKGRWFPNGATINSDPCQPCFCQDGTAVCAIVDCFPPSCPRPVRPPGLCCPVCQQDCSVVRCGRPACASAVDIPGECCPRCPEEGGVCYYNGRWRAVGDFTDGDRPCERCRCHRDRTVGCVSLSCPPPPCVSPVTVEGQCCPRCPPKGKTCFFNGQWYPEGPVTPSHPCEVFCTCVQGGRVICASVQCAFPECSKPVITLPGECCPVCPPKGGQCFYNGQWYPEGPVKTDNPCEKCSCTKEGQVVCATAACAAPLCDVALVSLPGQCCAVCPPRDGVCFFNGRWYPVGRFDDPDNPCVHCQCNKDRSIACLLDNCPILPCNNSVTIPGQCCPVCPSGGGVCFFNGRWYPVGRFDDPDNPCVHCQCNEDRSIACLLDNCPILPCNNSVTIPGQCCPVCPPVGAACFYMGQWYPGGPFILPDSPCTQCTCDRNSGQVICAAVNCPPADCPKSFRDPAECCPKCPGPGDVDIAVYYQDFFGEGEVCYYRGRFHPVSDFQDSNFPCEYCRCHSNGSVRCVVQDCARPPCEDPVRVPGVCCPQCPPDGLSCYYNGQWYPAGDFRLPDNPCAFCRCDGSTGQASCAFRRCPPPACDNPITVPEECCALCPGQGEVCYFRGRFYPVGEFRDPAFPCEYCTCRRDGEVTCAIQDCPRPQCEMPVSVPGQCCPDCPPPTQPPSPCSLVLCAMPQCPNSVTLAGQCCPTCPSDLDACFEPLKRGRSCSRKSETRFYFDLNSRTCKDFVYTGCGGNRNRFRTEAECHLKCSYRCPTTFKTKCPATGSSTEIPILNHECGTSPTHACGVGLSCCNTPCGRKCLTPIPRQTEG